MEIEHWESIGEVDESGAKWSHSGIAVVADGRIVFAEPGGRALLVLDEVIGKSSRVPTPTTDNHGITAGTDSSTVWVADPGPPGGAGQVLLVQLNTGEVLANRTPPASSRPWKPTSTALIASGAGRDDHWIADGYGQSLVHVIRASGQIETFDGSASGTHFDCPHGVTIDDRGSKPQVVVADRANRRLVFLDLNGQFARSIEHPLLTSPSSIAVRGADLLVTDLFGALLRVDLADKVHAVVAIDPLARRREGWPNAVNDGIEVRPTLQDGRLNSPHGIAIGNVGQIYLTEWLLGGRQLRLTVRTP